MLSRQIAVSEIGTKIGTGRGPVADTTNTTKLDISKLSPDAQALQDMLMYRIIGQERAIHQIIKAYVPTTVNMHRENRPMGVFMFLGPTGTGKSQTVKEFAKALLGRQDAITKIDCTEYQHDHEVSKLLGAPPSYVGYSDEPRLSQHNIDQYQTKDKKINIILFDEIEKADPRLFDTILAILGDGQLTLGNGKKVDFSKTFVFLTSNLGSEDTRKLIEGSGIGFGSSITDRDDLDEKIYRTSKEAVKHKYRPEFVNRLDKLVVFRSLSQESLRQILKLELVNLQQRIWSSPFRGFNLEDKSQPLPNRRSVVFRPTPTACNFLLKEGTSEIYGARELNRIIDRYVGFPMAALISSGQLEDGDKVKIDYIDGEKDLTFLKEK